MFLKSRHVHAFDVSIWGLPFFEQLVSQDANLWETMHALNPFQVQIYISDDQYMVTLINEVLGKIYNGNVDILWMVEGDIQVKVADIYTKKLSFRCQDHTV